MKKLVLFFLLLVSVGLSAQDQVMKLTRTNGRTVRVSVNEVRFIYDYSTYSKVIRGGSKAPIDVSETIGVIMTTYPSQFCSLSSSAAAGRGVLIGKASVDEVLPYGSGSRILLKNGYGIIGVTESVLVVDGCLNLPGGDGYAISGVWDDVGNEIDVSMTPPGVDFSIDLQGIMDSINASGTVSGSGTLNYLSKWTPDGSTLGDSQIFDDGTNVTIGGPALATAGVNIENTATGALRIEEDAGSGTQFLIDASGNVGVNVPTATEKIDVNGNILLRSQNKALFGSSATAAYRNTTANGLAFQTNSLDRLFIADAGNVGIGTTSPGYPLEVNGEGYFSTHLRLGGGSIISESSLFSINQAAYYNLPIKTNNQTRLLVKNSGELQFNTYGSGTNTGTATYNLSVDASGNVIETAAAVSGPAGNDTEVQFNNAGSFGADPDLTFDGTTTKGVFGTQIDAANIRYLATVKGGAYKAGGGTGAIKVTLPDLTAAGPDGLGISFKVNIHTNTEAHLAHVNIYCLASTPQIYGQSIAYYVSSSDHLDIPISLGEDGNNMVVYFGKVSSTWGNMLDVIVTDVSWYNYSGGYADLTEMGTGWTVGLTTSTPGIRYKYDDPTQYSRLYASDNTGAAAVYNEYIPVLAHNYLGSTPGAIEITLPTASSLSASGWNYDWTIDGIISTQSLQRSRRFTINGKYTYSSQNWTIGDVHWPAGAPEGYQFRFGDDGTNGKIWINDVGDSNAGLYVTLSNLQVFGLPISADSQFVDFRTGWDISLENTAVDNVDLTQEATTAGAIPFVGTYNHLYDNTSFVYDNTNNRLGIGTATPTEALDVTGNVLFSGTLQGSGYGLGTNTGTATYNLSVDASGNVIETATAATSSIYTGDGTAPADVDVTVTDNIDFDAGTLFIDGTNDRVGIGTTSTTATLNLKGEDDLDYGSGGVPSFRLENNSGTQQLAIHNNYEIRLFDQTGGTKRIYENGGAIDFNSWDTSNGFIFSGGTDATTTGHKSAAIFGNNTFNPSSGTKTYTLAEIKSTINQTGGASGITRGLHVNPTLVAAADFRAIEMANSSGYGIYQAGTADNYFAGNVGIGTTSPGYPLVVDADVSGTLFEIRNKTTQPTYFNITNPGTGHGAGNGLLVGYNGQGILLNRENTDLSLGTNDITRLLIRSTGAFQFSAYGSGTNTGTPTYNLSVDASGNVIETAVGAASSIYTGDGTAPADVDVAITDSIVFGAETLVISETEGRVGIGRAPYNLAKLSVFGDGTGVTTNTILANNGGSTLFRMLDNGSSIFNLSNLSTGDFVVEGQTDANLITTDASGDRVGIGIAPTVGKFTVQGDDSGSTLNTYLINSTNQNIISYFNDGGISANGSALSTGYFRFQSPNVPYLLMAQGSSDRVGIGTGTPGALLEVNHAVANTGGEVAQFVIDQTSAADDDYSAIGFYADDGGGTKHKFTEMRSVVSNVADGVERGKFEFLTDVSGTLTRQLEIGAFSVTTGSSIAATYLSPMTAAQQGSLTPAQGAVTTISDDLEAQYYDGTSWESMVTGQTAYMSITDEAFTLTATGGGTFDPVTNGTNTLFDQEISTAARVYTVQGDSIIIGDDGIYEISYDLSFSAANSSVYRTGVLVNGTAQAGGRAERGMSGSDSGVVAGRLTVVLSANDVVKLGLAEDAGTTDATIYNGNISVRYIGKN